MPTVSGVLLHVLWSWSPALAWLFPAGYLFFNRRIDIPHRGLWFVSLLLTSWLGMMLFLINLRLEPENGRQAAQ